MQRFNPPDPNFESRVRSAFSQQQLMKTIGATLAKVVAGEVHIEMPFSPEWTQQNGYLHAGIITAIVDSACGFAAYTLMPAGAGVLSVEYKINLLNPARGEKFLSIGKVIKPGRTLTVCTGEVLALEKGARKLIAAMQATMITVSI